MNARRLYRSRDRQLAGVAGGMAEYLDIDPTVIRILWIIVGIASAGLALLAYFVLALVIPNAPFATAPGGPAAWASAPGSGAGTGFAPSGAAAGWPAQPAAWAAPQAASAAQPTGWVAPQGAPAWGQAATPAWTATAVQDARVGRRSDGRAFGAGAIVGVVLIVFGAVALANVAVPGWVGGAVLGPAVILALGAALLVSSIRRRDDMAAEAAAVDPAGQAAGAGPMAAATPADTTDTQAVNPSILGFAATTDGGDDGGLDPA